MGIKFWVIIFLAFLGVNYLHKRNDKKSKLLKRRMEAKQKEVKEQYKNEDKPQKR